MENYLATFWCRYCKKEFTNDLSFEPKVKEDVLCWCPHHNGVVTCAMLYSELTGATMVFT